MTHDPTAAAAAYVAGEMTTGERSAFEDHLVACEACRADVAAGQRGQALVDQTWEAAPAWLSARITETITSAPPRRRSRPTLVAAVAVLLAAVVASFLSAGAGDPEQTSAVDAAVVAYREDRLPARSAPQAPAPNLKEAGFIRTTAGAGDLEGQPVTVYAYRDFTGRRVVVFISDQPFRAPEDAEHPEGPRGPWEVARSDVIAVCAPEPHDVLVVGDDRRLVDTATYVLGMA